MNNKLKTSDIYFAAAVMAQGHKLIETDRSEPRRCFFVFEIGPMMANDIWDDFINGSLTAPCVQLFDAFHKLKRVMYQE